MVDFYSLFYQIESSGFYEFVLPFFLVFTIVFGILEKTKIFGEVDNRPRSNLNVVLAIILALTILLNTDIIFLLNNTLPKLSFFIVIAVLVMLLVALFHTPEEGKNISVPLTWATLLAIGAVLWSLATSYYGEELWPYWIYLDDSTISFIFFLVLFGIIVYIVTGPHERKNKKEYKIVTK